MPKVLSLADATETLQDANVGCATALDAIELYEEAHGEEERYKIANPELKEVSRSSREGMLASTKDLASFYRDTVYPAVKMRRPLSLTAKQFGLTVDDIFSSSAKLSNSPEWGWWSPGLYLASGKVAGTDVDLCPFASDGCRINCLLQSGQRAGSQQTALEVLARLLPPEQFEKEFPNLASPEGLGLTNPTQMSLRRTYLWRYGNEEFNKMLRAAIAKEKTVAEKKGLRLCVRLNCTSDLHWERESLMREHPDVVFYDYTKIPMRAMAFAESQAPKYFGSEVKHKVPSGIRWPNPEWPKNYHISFSYSEINMAWCLIMLKLGVNIVVPFTDTLGYGPWAFPKGGKYDEDKAILPKTFLGHPVIDGDAYDLRFIDNQVWSSERNLKPPFVVGLRIKGNYQKASGNAFFFDGAKAQKAGSDPLFIADQLFENTKECVRQGKKGAFLPPKALVEKYLDGEVRKAYEEAAR